MHSAPHSPRAQPKPAAETLGGIAGAMAPSVPRPGRRVIVYIGADPKKDGSMFYLNLFWSLMKLGQEQGIEMIPVIDLRPPSMVVLEPPQVSRIRGEGPVDGLIGFMVFPAMATWMKESGIPWTVLCDGKERNYVDLDYRAMVQDALGRLAELGCKSAGLMIPASFPDAAFLEHVDAVSEAVGVKVKYEWILAFRESQEQTGYELLCALWDCKDRPEGLVIFPDRAARGAVSAILEKRIRVPDELRLILHRNAESPYVVPMPCDWLEVSVSAMADALMGNLHKYWEGRPLAMQRTRMRLVRG